MQGGSGAINLASLCVDELDSGVVDNNVPFQFDPFADYNATNKARGVLTILLTGNTAANAGAPTASTSTPPAASARRPSPTG